MLWGRPERWHETGSGRFLEVSEGRCRVVPHGAGREGFRKVPHGSRSFAASGRFWMVPQPSERFRVPVVWMFVEGSGRLRMDSDGFGPSGVRFWNGKVLGG